MKTAGKIKITSLGDSSGFNLIEAMLGLMIFLIGWAGVFSLVTESYKLTGRSWGSLIARQVLDNEYWTLQYRSAISSDVDLAGDSVLDFGKVDTWSTAKFRYGVIALPNGNNKACRLVVGDPILQDLTTPIPKVFIGIEGNPVGDPSGMLFSPTPFKDDNGYEVCWEVVEVTDYDLGDALDSNPALSGRYNSMFNFVRSYDILLTVRWPYSQFNTLEGTILTRKFSIRNKTK